MSPRPPARLLRDVGHPPGDIGEDLVPGDFQELILARAVESVLAQVRLSELWEPVVGPLFPPFPDNRILEAVWTVDPPRERVSLRTAPGIPGDRRLVPVQIAVSVHVVVLLEPEDNAVLDEGA